MSPKYNLFYDITDFGAADGAKCSKAIQAAIDLASKEYPKQLIGASSWPRVAAVIRFPCPLTFEGDTAGSYLLEEQIHIDAKVNLALVGDSVRSVLLRYQGAGPAIVVHGGDGSRAIAIERLAFHHGGVGLYGKMKAGVTLRNVGFHCTNGWALAARGEVAWVRITNCHFTETGTPETGAIWIGPSAHHWQIASTTFVRNEGRSLLVQGRDVQVRDCDFNTKSAASSDTPFVHIEAPAQRVLLQSCRFGNEGVLPDDLNVIGPLMPGAPSACVLDVRFDKCASKSQSIVDVKDAPAFVRVSAPVSGLRLDHCSAQQAYSALVDEQVLTIPVSTSPQDVTVEIPTARSRDNVLSGQLADLWFTYMQPFTHEGHAFEVQGKAARSVVPRGLVGSAGGNLLRETELLTAPPWLWSSTDPVFPLKNPPLAGADDPSMTVEVLPYLDGGPTGSTAKVWEVKPKGIGTTCIAQALTKVRQEAVQAAPLVFSVWIKGLEPIDAVPRPVRLEIRLLDPNLAPRSTSIVVVPRKRWIRHSVVAEGVPAEAAVMVVVYHGDGLLPWSGSFLLSMPQIEVGRAPRQYRKVQGVLPQHRAILPMGARLVGSSLVVFGDGPPVFVNEDLSQRSEVGDRVLSTSVTPQDMQAPVGWVCVQAGSPGSWRALGGHG